MRPTCRRVMPPICQTTRTPCLTDGRRGSAAGLRGARSSLRVRPTPLASPGLVGRTPAAAPWRDTRGGSDSPATDAVARCWTTPARPSPPVAPRQRRKPSPLSWRSTGVSPAGRSVPKRVRHAISSARSASWARPRRANSQPTRARSCSRSPPPSGPSHPPHRPRGRDPSPSARWSAPCANAPAAPVASGWPGAAAPSSAAPASAGRPACG